MRYEDASGSFSGNAAAAPDARDDVDALAAGSRGPATGNTITGAGTTTGKAGADVASGDAQVTAVEGAGGSDASGSLRVDGRYGTLNIEPDGDYSYMRKAGAPDGVSDTFRYTLSESDGAKDTATLTINIEGEEVKVAENAQQIIPGPDGVVTLPPGVTLSDVQVVGRNLVITLPDGSQMVIIDGAIFVPQLVLGGVEVPASNLAALLIDSEPKPAAGTPLSSGGNFAVDVPPLDPGVPLGDLIPPTEFGYTPPEFEDLYDDVEVDTVPSIISAGDTVVDEDGLPGANVDSSPLQSDPGETDSTESTTDTGQIVVDFRSDVPANLMNAIKLVDTSALDGQLQTLNGTNIVFALEAGALVGRPSGGGDPVVIITITGASAGSGGLVTYTYEVELLAPLKHPDSGNNENTELLSGVTFQVTDSDGDTATGTINVTIVDDVPSIAAVDLGLVSNFVLDESPAGQDEGGDNSPAGLASQTIDFAPAFGGLTFEYGADGPGSHSFGLALSTEGAASGLYALEQGDTSASDGDGIGQGAQILLFTNNDGSISGRLTADGPAYFTISAVTAGPDAGEVTFTQHLNVWHANTSSDDDTSTLTAAANTIRLVHSVTDGDGDTDEVAIDLSAGIFNIEDDGPDGSDQLITTTIDLVVDETRPEGTEEDGDNNPAGRASDSSTAFAALFGAPNYGTDGPGTLTYSLALSSEGLGSGLYALQAGDTSTTDGDGYGQGAEILLFTNGDGSISGRLTADGPAYFTISTNASTGEVTFTQHLNVWHANTESDDDTSTLTIDQGTLTLVQTITDRDGDSDTKAIDLSNGVFHIEDDGPRDYDPCPDDVISINDPDANPFTGNLNLPDVGTDLPGVVSFGVETGDPVLDSEGNPVTSGDDELVYVVNGNVLEAHAGDTSGALVFTITLNGDGTFTYDQILPIGSGGETVFDNLTSSAAGNVDYRGVGTNDAATEVDLILSGSGPAGADEGVNTDSDSIGVDNQSMDAGETVRIDFVSNLQTSAVAAGTPMGLTYDAHVNTNSYLQTIAQVQGTQTNEVAFQVWALDTSDTQANEPDRNPAGGFANSTSVAITSVTVIGFDAGEGTPITVDISGVAAGVWTDIGYGISVQKQADGSVIFTGVQEGDQYGIGTGSNTFNAVAVQSEAAGTGPVGNQSNEDSFDLGVFAIGTTSSFEPVHLEVPIVLTDADGDAVSCEIDIHIGAPLGTSDVAVTVNEAGLPVIGSDAASDSEIQSGVLTPVGGTGPYTFTLLSDANGQFGNLVLNSETGEFTYTLDTPFDSQPDSNDGTNPELGAESFDVLVTDSLGATHTATIRINIIDDVPSVDVTANDEAAVLLTTQDADTIGAATDQDATAVNFAGAFGVTTVPGADGQQSLVTSYSLAVTNSVSGLFSNALAINLYNVGGVIVGSTAGAPPATLDDASIVFTISVSNTGVVTLRQMQQIDHTNADPSATEAPFDDHLIALADGKVTLTRETTITDNDGDVDTDSAVIDLGGNIRFADDGPVANGETDSVTGNGGTATGNVLTAVEVAVAEDANGTDGVADNVGADTPGRISFVDNALDVAAGSAVPNGGFVDIAGQYGTLRIFSNGDYVYTRTDGLGGGEHEEFTYTLMDADGDTDTATLRIEIGDLTPSLATPAALQLDDDNVVGVTGNPGGPGDDAVSDPLGGTLSGSGGDGDLDYFFNTTQSAPAGFTYNVTTGATTQTLEITQTSTGLIVTTITLTNETGVYTVVQNNPVQHDPLTGVVGQDDTENNTPNFNISFIARDADNDASNAVNLVLNIDDDTPVLSNVAAGGGVTLDETTAGSPAGFPISLQSASAAITATQAFGADGPAASGSVSYGLSIVGDSPELTTLRTAVGDHLITLVQIDADTIQGQYNGSNVAFQIDIGSDGKVTLTQHVPLEHNIDGSSAAAHDDSLNLNGLVNATITITDSDGDSTSASAAIGNQLVFKDDGPDAQLSGTAVGTVTLDETRPEGTDRAGAAPTGTDSETINFAANFVTGGSVNYGADGAAASNSVTYALVLTGSNVGSGLYALEGTDTSTIDGDGYGQGDQIVLNQSGNTITGSANGTNYFTITIDPATGVVTFTQLNNIWHPTGGTATFDETATLTTLNANLLKVVQTVTDSDGDFDTAEINIGQGVFNIQDDGPQAIQPQEATVTNTAGQSALGVPLDDDGSLAGDFGTDLPGKITFANITNGMDTTQKANNVTIELWLSPDGQTLQGRTGSTDGTDGTLIYEVKINANGTYDFVLHDEIDNGSGSFFGNLSGGVAGNPPFKLIESTSADSVEMLVTPINTNSVNSDSDDIAAGSQFVEFNTGIRFDFGDFTYVANGGGTADDQWIIEDNETVNGFKFTIDQISNGTVVDIRLTAYDGDDDGGVPRGAINAGDPTGDPVDPITMVKIFDTSGTLVGTFTGDDTLGGIGIDFDTNMASPTFGSVQFTNLPSDYSIQTYTADGYSRLEVFNTGTASPDGKFSLSLLQIETTQQGSPLDLYFDVAITDADGDSIVVDDGIHINVDPAGSSSMATTSMVSFQPEGESSSLMGYEDSSEQQFKTAANTNTVLLGAVAAAGMAASSAAAAEGSDSGPGQVTSDFTALVSPTVDLSDFSVEDGSRSADLMSGQVDGDSGSSEGQAGSLAGSNDAAQDTSLTDAGEQPATQPTALSEGVEAVEQSAPSSSGNDAVAMVSAEMLGEAADSVEGGPKHTGEVGRVVADALAGGSEGPDVDAIVEALSNQTGGAGQPALDALATQGGSNVPSWDMGSHGSFHGGGAAFTMEPLLHHDAVQSAA